jgi:hypothetical protein
MSVPSRDVDEQRVPNYSRPRQQFNTRSEAATSPAKQALLALEGLKPEDVETYIPTYFRKRSSTMETADLSTISLKSLEEKSRLLPSQQGSDKGPSFLESIQLRLSRVRALGTALGQDLVGVHSIQFAPGKLCTALDEFIDTKSKELDDRPEVSSRNSWDYNSPYFMQDDLHFLPETDPKGAPLARSLQLRGASFKVPGTQ